MIVVQLLVLEDPGGWRITNISRVAKSYFTAFGRLELEVEAGMG